MAKLYNRNGSAMQEPMAKNGSPSPSPSPLLNKNYATRFFEEFWKTYPCRNGKRIGKERTYALYQKLKEQDFEPLQRACLNYAASELVRKGIGIKDPERFIKGNYWRDWIEPERYPENKSIIETPTRDQTNFQNLVKEVAEKKAV